MAYQQMPNYQAYQQQYPQPYQDRLAQLQNQYQQTIPVQQPQINQGLLWVQGEAGAKSYLVAPNTTVLLMDSEEHKFYIKSTNSAGMPSLVTYEYKEVSPSIVQNPAEAFPNLDDKYVTRTEYERLMSRCDEMIEKIKSLDNAPVTEKSVTRSEAKPTRGKRGDTDEQSDI